MILLMIGQSMLFSTEEHDSREKVRFLYTYREPEAPMVKPLFFTKIVQEKKPYKDAFGDECEYEEAIAGIAGLFCDFHSSNERNIQALTDAGFFKRNTHSNLSEVEQRALREIIYNIDKGGLLWYCWPHLKHSQDRKELYEDFIQFYNFCDIAQKEEWPEFEKFPKLALDEFRILFKYYRQHGIPK